MIAALVAETGWGIPVIAYDSSYDSNSLTAIGKEGLAALRWRADLVIEAQYPANATVTSRPDGTFDSLQWPNEKLAGPLPNEIAHLARLPGPPRRHF